MEPQKCQAKSKQSGEQCKRWASPGQRVCTMHGAKAPKAIAAAERRLEEESAKEAVATYGLPREVSPTQALAEELHRTAGIVAYLDLRVGELDNSGLGAHPLVRLYADERKHFADVAKTCIAVGIEARRIEIAEEEARLFMLAIKGIMLDLGVWDHPEAPQIVRRHLAAVA